MTARLDEWKSESRAGERERERSERMLHGSLHGELLSLLRGFERGWEPSWREEGEGEGGEGEGEGEGEGGEEDQVKGKDEGGSSQSGDLMKLVKRLSRVSHRPTFPPLDLMLILTLSPTPHPDFHTFLRIHTFGPRRR